MTPIPKRKGNQGFSLLELIIVLVIIGVMIAAITISITDRRLDNLKLESERLQALILLAIDQAVITNKEIGLLIEDDGYKFLEYNDETWQEMDQQNSPRFVSRKLPEEVYARIQVAGLYNDDAETEYLVSKEAEPFADTDTQASTQDPLPMPQVLMLSSSEVTPFIIRLGWDFDDPAYMEIITEVDGSIRLRGPIYEPLNTPWDADWLQ